LHLDPCWLEEAHLEGVSSPVLTIKKNSTNNETLFMHENKKEVYLLAKNLNKSQLTMDS